MRTIALVYALALVWCLPYLAHTYSLTGRWFYWGSSGGMSLYWMSTPYRDGQTYDLHAITGTAGDKGSIMFSLGYQNQAQALAQCLGQLDGLGADAEIGARNPAVSHHLVD